jgi:hypothetical protein
MAISLPPTDRNTASITGVSGRRSRSLSACLPGKPRWRQTPGAGARRHSRGGSRPSQIYCRTDGSRTSRRGTQAELLRPSAGCPIKQHPLATDGRRAPFARFRAPRYRPTQSAASREVRAPARASGHAKAVVRDRFERWLLFGQDTWSRGHRAYEADLCRLLLDPLPGGESRRVPRRRRARARDHSNSCLSGWHVAPTAGRAPLMR